MKGIVLVPGTIVQLDLDGTLVYVEDVQPTHAAVVALPEQESKGIFKPGCVGAKKISPYSAPSRVIPVDELSERNKNFIGTFEQLRKQHGPLYVDRSPEEIATMTVMKVTGTRKPRKEKRVKAKREGRMYQKCVKCGQQPGHWDHGTPEQIAKFPERHEFVAPPADAATETAAPAKAPREKKERAPKVDAGPTTFTLVSSDLSKAQAQPRGEKFNEGNRSFRVVKALASLPGKSGTLEDVVTALCTDGGAVPANPVKVVKRTLNQLTKPAFGSIVSRTGDAPAESDDDEDA